MVKSNRRRSCKKKTLDDYDDDDDCYDDYEDDCYDDEGLDDDIECWDKNPYLTGSYSLENKSKKKMAKSTRRKKSRKTPSQYQKFVGAYIRKNHRAGMGTKGLMKKAARLWSSRGCKSRPSKKICKPSSVRKQRRRRRRNCY